MKFLAGIRGIIAGVVFMLSGTLKADNATMTESSILEFDGQKFTVSACPEPLRWQAAKDGKLDLALLSKLTAERLAVLEILKAADLEPSPVLTDALLQASFDAAEPGKQQKIIAELSVKGITWAEERRRLAADPEEQFRTASIAWIEKDIAPQITVTDAELQHMYKTAPHKLLNVPELRETAAIGIAKTTENAGKSARRVLAQIQQGEHFDVLEKRYNDLSITELQRAMQVDAALTAAEKLTPENPAVLVDLPQCYLVLKLAALAPERELSFSEVKPTLTRKIYDIKIRRKVDSTIAEELKKHKIIYYSEREIKP